MEKHTDQLAQQNIRSQMFKSKLIMVVGGIGLILNGYPLLNGSASWTTLLVMAVLVGVIGQHAVKLRGLSRQLKNGIS